MPSRRRLPNGPAELAKNTAVDPSHGLSHSLSNSAPTVLIKAKSIDTLETRQIRSIMTARTIHESLHRGHAPSKNSRSVKFGQVCIRQYERILGDNPAVTSGPPLSIGWRYASQPLQTTIDDFESKKGQPRVKSEFLMPKAVREDILREHAETSRREMVTVVRSINRLKQQRRTTFANLHMATTEEKIEKVKRGLQKIVTSRTSYSKEEERLWHNAHIVAQEKARRLEESLRNGEKLSMKNLYEVGMPWNGIEPSKRNTDEGSTERNDSKNIEEDPPSNDNHVVIEGGNASSDQVPEIFKSLSSHDRVMRLTDFDSTLDTSLERGGQCPPHDGKFRHSESDVSLMKLEGTGSGNIVASEDHSVDEIVSNLLLDDLCESC